MKKLNFFIFSIFNFVVFFLSIFAAYLWAMFNADMIQGTRQNVFHGKRFCWNKTYLISVHVFDNFSVKNKISLSSGEKTVWPIEYHFVFTSFPQLVWPSACHHVLTSKTLITASLFFLLLCSLLLFMFLSFCLLFFLCANFFRFIFLSWFDVLYWFSKASLVKIGTRIRSQTHDSFIVCNDLSHFFRTNFERFFQTWTYQSREPMFRW